MSEIQYNLDNLKRSPLPLYHRYTDQNKPQPAYVEMDNFGTVAAKWVGHHTPVLHLSAFRWEVSPCADGESLAALLESPRMQSLFSQVHEGSSIVSSDDCQFVTLEPFSRNAGSEIQSMLRPESSLYSRWEVWNSEEWFRSFFSAAEVAAKDSLTDYMTDVVHKKMLEAEKHPRFLLDGPNSHDLVLYLCAEYVESAIQKVEGQNGEKIDEHAEKLAQILAEHGQNRYDDILDRCRALGMNDLGSMPFNQDHYFFDEFAEYRSRSAPSEDKQEGA